MSARTLVIVRHAHRPKLLGREADNGLSAKGRKQANRVFEYFKRSFDGAKGREVRIVSSPKLRCIETVEPLIRWSKSELSISPLLDEGGKLREKARRFRQEWESSSARITVACSHGDWIPVFLELVTGAAIELAKGGWAQIEFEAGHARLSWLFQGFEEHGA